MSFYLLFIIVRIRYGNRVFFFEDDDVDIVIKYEIFVVVIYVGMLESGYYVIFLRLYN